MVHSPDSASERLGAPGFEYDAFISYRRGDGGWHARTLRHRLLDVRLPPELTSALAGHRLRIYLDQIYEKATDDFFEHTIKPALRDSRHLIVVQSPSAMDALPDGSPNWLVREIDYFRTLPTDGRSISVAIPSGELTGPLPGRLDHTHPNIERLDLRGWRRYRRAGLDEHLLSLAATLYDIRPADMPVLRQEDVRRRAVQQRRRTIAASVVAIALVLLGAIALWQYGNARLATERRNMAMAGSLWDRLDFADMSRLTDDELNALWEIGAGDAPVRTEFLDQLSRDRLRAARLGRGRGPILRALSLGWPPDRAGALWQTVADGASESDGSERLAATALALDGLARTLSSQQAYTFIDPLVKRIVQTTDDDLLDTLGAAVQGLADQLAPEQAQQAFGPVVDAMRSTEPAAAARLAWTAQLIAARLTATQVQALSPPILKDFSAEGDDADDLLPFLALVLTGMADKLTAEQSRGAFDRVIRRLGTADSDEMAALVPLIRRLVPHISSRQARGASGAVLRAVKKLNAESDQFNATYAAIIGRNAPNEAAGLFKEMELTLLQLAARLSPRDAAAVLGPLLNTIAGTTDPEILGATDVGAAAVASRVSPAQALESYHSVEQAILRSTDVTQEVSLSLVGKSLADRVADDEVWIALLRLVLQLPELHWSRALAVALPAEALASRTTPRDAESVLLVTAKAITDNPDKDRLWALGLTARALGRRLDVADARKAIPELLTAIERSADAADARKDDPELDAARARSVDIARVSALASVLEGLSGQLTQDQAQKLFPLLMAAVTMTVNSKEVTALAAAAAAVAGKLSTESAQLALPSVVTVLENFGTSINQLSAVGDMVNVFVGKVGAPQLAATIRPLFRVIRATQATAQLPTLKRVVDVTGGLSAEDVRYLHAELAWAPSPAMAAVWAEVLVQLAPRDPVHAYVATLVEALKSPPSAGAATAVILDGLRSAVASAPGASAGLAATIAWISTAFPDVDLGAAPECPAPPREGLACPAGSGS